MEATQKWYDDWLREEVASKAPATQEQYLRLGASIPERFPKLADLTHKNIRREFKTMRDTPVQANRWKAVVSSFCAYLMEEEELDANPTLGIRKHTERPKERTLTYAEITDLGGGLRHCDIHPATAACIRLLLSTGCRVNEAVGLVWEELEPDEGGWLRWTLPAERTKANRTLVTLIPPEVATSLRELKLDHRHKVFCTGGTGYLGIHTVRRALDRLCKKIPMDHFSPHDLRRTVGTILAMEGVPVDVRKAVLNHAPSGVTNIVYNKYDYFKEKKEALKLLHAELNSLEFYS